MTEHTPRRGLRLHLLVWLLAGCPVLSSAGCDRALPGGDDSRVLRIATTWPRDEWWRLDTAFREWHSKQPDRSSVPLRLDWIAISRVPRPGQPGDPVPRTNVLLGGPLTDYLRNARIGRLAPVDGTSGASFMELRPRRVALLARSESPGSGLALDDPRVTPATLTWLASRVDQRPWKDSYAEMMRLAGRCRQPAGWCEGAALGALERGQAESALAVVARTSIESHQADEGLAVPLTEGVAILTGADSPIAREFLRFLAETMHAAPPASSELPDPELDDLVGDLLGSTLVDAHDELRLAWRALGGVDAARPSAALTWMTDPPPWPPASVVKLLSRSDDRGVLLIHDLAGHVAPDPELRFWLIQSWLGPQREVDPSFLRELARAAGGRLTREPRFRSWLRSEWTAWARQRYRRVARLASAAVPEGSDRPER